MYNAKAVKCYEKGRVLHQQGKLSDAERAYKKAIKINKDFFEAHSNLGNVLVDRGRLREASDSYRKALRLLPDHPMLLNNLGNALQLRGDNEKAIGWFNKAIAQDPNYADAYCNLGNALRDMGSMEEAVDAYRNAIRIDPDMADPYSNLGCILTELDELDEAVKNFKTAIGIDSWHKEACNGLGNALLAQGEVDDAIASYYKAIDIDPGHKDAFKGLGDALTSKGNMVKAIAAYQKAIEIDPSNLDAYTGLGNAQRERGELEEAMASIDRVIEIDPGNVDALVGLGSVLHDQGETDKAIAKFLEAIDIDPGYVNAYTALASLLSDQGEIDKAIARYREAIAIDPKFAGAYRSLAKNKKFTEHDDDVVAMESLYAAEDIVDDQKMSLAFGLGKAYEDLGEYDKSMKLIIEATRLKRASIDYSVIGEEDNFNKVKEIFSAEFFSHHQGIGHPDKTAIFILGMPRSGTSLTEQILASHADVHGAGELTYVGGLIKKISITDPSRKFPEIVIDLGEGEFEDLGKKYIARIRSHSDARHITDKMPGNFFHIGFIKTILPNAKVIHCNRDPMDNALSIFKNYFGKGHYYSYDMTELGHYYRLYLDLMEYWRNTLPGFIYDLSYEKLVTDHENQIRKLLDFCNLPWDDACLDFHKTDRRIKTASNAQVRRPIYKDSVKLWKRYEKQLKPLEEAIYR